MPEITQEEYEAFQREAKDAKARREREEKEAEERRKLHPPTHNVQLASGRFVDGNTVATHHTYVTDDGEDVIVPIVAAYPK